MQFNTGNLANQASLYQFQTTRDYEPLINVVHDAALSTDSKGNLYTAESHGRVQKFVFKGFSGENEGQLKPRQLATIVTCKSSENGGRSVIFEIASPVGKVLHAKRLTGNADCPPC